MIVLAGLAGLCACLAGLPECWAGLLGCSAVSVGSAVWVAASAGCDGWVAMLIVKAAVASQPHLHSMFDHFEHPESLAGFLWADFGMPVGLVIDFHSRICSLVLFWVLRGALGLPVDVFWLTSDPFGRAWAPMGCPWGSLWGTSGVSLVALGPLGLPGAARASSRVTLHPPRECIVTGCDGIAP